MCQFSRHLTGRILSNVIKRQNINAPDKCFLLLSIEVLMNDIVIIFYSPF